MISCNWQQQAERLFTASPVIPVLVIHELNDVVPMAQAILAGGIRVLEVTLRTPIALDAIQLLRRNLPEAMVGAGTILNAHQLQQAMEADAEFAISPGLTPTLLQAGQESDIPFIPGASSLSELMMGMDYGYKHFKCFPAEAIGGVKTLKSIAGPLPDLRFCATGGINEQNFLDYLILPNVACVGGSWVIPTEAIIKKDWQRITEICALAVKKAKQCKLAF
ncbi:bifunctional 4-hydroxy-2-oxoglutarate aldolase/2-dehydro-3-deoxy-phosphogluconate aldolase [Legionella oakridgensis]|uniref:2-dehydro-3-deoxy-phosphogluconate aldolase n=2 Tax=Legionella oakridgensis TaxID=29423 RepID=W0BFV0_9GAMM|nr:bifunctional 4-hydroxy-2-oxoglutarate aldolase/2-dehydro-3-deoxy-phosphogluconate aldolase [Legionella oakridgensis]AHE67299.1 entner-doudoroff aldolase [Legionella oakridgensis ATCC 33761 = DSM 21215]KTD37913.1 2-deydro-3-deoxyphosphogluconate aldolase/4-hydroxy-2-oxoglutarate aldolase [Legionella oakridgensis]STY20365.1 2-deydro-3-deoxyphosphogluconate aldolase/4-hydroxy-2-oxoglutarate aldolase [Legionella longbeachae]